MSRIVGNMTEIAGNYLRQLVKYGIWRNVSLSTDQGAPYGVDDKSAKILREEVGRIKSSITDLTLVGVHYRRREGPWLKVTVEEFATRNDKGELDGGINEETFQEWIYENRSKFPQDLRKYVEARKAKRDKRA